MVLIQFNNLVFYNWPCVLSSHFQYMRILAYTYQFHILSFSGYNPLFNRYLLFYHLMDRQFWPTYENISFLMISTIKSIFLYLLMLIIIMIVILYLLVVSSLLISSFLASHKPIFRINVRLAYLISLMTSKDLIHWR